MDINLVNNRIWLEGKVVDEPKFSHEMFGEGFYNFDIEVMRLSDSKDVLSVTISERIMVGIDFSIGTEIMLEGQLRMGKIN